MNALELNNVHVGGLAGAQLSVVSGMHVVLGEPADGTAELVRVVSGTLGLKLGSVRVAGEDPRRSSPLRRSIASVWSQEPPMLRDCVRVVAERALSFMGAGGASGVLEKAGLTALAEQRHQVLTEHQRRCLALQLALAHPSPRVVVLYEPLALAPAGDESELVGKLHSLVARAPVLVCTANADHAALLGGTLHVLRAGRLGAAVPGDATAVADRGAEVEILVRTPEARRACALLAELPAVRAVHFDDDLGRVVVKGEGLVTVAGAITDVFRRNGLQLWAMVPRVPSLVESRHARSARKPAGTSRTTTGAASA